MRCAAVSLRRKGVTTPRECVVCVAGRNVQSRYRTNVPAIRRFLGYRRIRTPRTARHREGVTDPTPEGARHPADPSSHARTALGDWCPHRAMSGAGPVRKRFRASTARRGRGPSPSFGSRTPPAAAVRPRVSRAPGAPHFGPRRRAPWGSGASDLNLPKLRMLRAVDGCSGSAHRRVTQPTDGQRPRGRVRRATRESEWRAPVKSDPRRRFSLPAFC